MSQDNDKLVIPKFKATSIKNEAKTREAGRPIFDDMEIVEVRFAGDRNKVSVFPAHAFARWITDETGNQTQQTYAERWSDQYKRFKANHQQIAEGTPIEELTFLTMAKRSELKALSIYTAEALAALDGQPLKNLGQGGRELKNQAIAYLDNARGSADVVAMAAQIAELQRTIAEMQGGQPAPSADTAPAVSAFQEWEPDQIKDWIETNTGERPRGNPSHATLVRRADEVSAAGQKAAA